MTSQDNTGKNTTEASEWVTLAGFGLCTTYLIFLIATHLREGGAAMTLPHDSALLDLALLPARSFGLLGAYLVTGCLCGMTLLLWMKQKLHEIPRRAIGLPLLILALSSLVALIEGGSSVWGGLSGELLRDAYEMVLPRPLAYLVASVLVVFGMIMARDWFFFEEIRRVLTNQPAAPAFALGIGGDASEIDDADVRAIPRQDRKSKNREIPTFELGSHMSMSATAELLEPGSEIASLGTGKPILDDLDPIATEVESRIPSPEDEIVKPNVDAIAKTGLMEQVDLDVQPEAEAVAELPALESEVEVQEVPQAEAAESEIEAIEAEEEEAFDPMDPIDQLDWSAPVSVHSDVDLFGAGVDDSDEERSLEREMTSRESSRRRPLDSEVVNSATVLDEAIADLTDDLEEDDVLPEQEFEEDESDFEDTDLEEEDEFEDDFEDDEDDEASQEFDDEEEEYELEEEEYDEEDDEVLQEEELEGEEDLDEVEYEDDDEYLDEEDDDEYLDEEEDDDVEYEADEDDPDVELSEEEAELEEAGIAEQEAEATEDETVLEPQAAVVDEDENPTVLMEKAEAPEPDTREKAPITEPSEFGTDTTNLLGTPIDELFEEEEAPEYEIDDFANIVVEEAGEQDAGVEQVDYEVASPVSFDNEEADSVHGDLVDEPEEIEIQHLLFGAEDNEPPMDMDQFDHGLDMTSAEVEDAADRADVVEITETEDDIEELDDAIDEVESTAEAIEEEAESPSGLELYSSSASIAETTGNAKPAASPVMQSDDDDWAPWGEDSAPPRPAFQESVTTTVAAEATADDVELEEDETEIETAPSTQEIDIVESEADELEDEELEEAELEAEELEAAELEEAELEDEDFDEEEFDETELEDDEFEEEELDEAELEVEEIEDDEYEEVDLDDDGSVEGDFEEDDEEGEDVDWFEAEFAMLDEVDEVDEEESDEIQEDASSPENRVEIDEDSEISEEILEVSVNEETDENPEEIEVVAEELEFDSVSLTSEEGAVTPDIVEDSEPSTMEVAVTEPVAVQAGALESPFQELAEEFYRDAVALCLSEDTCRISFLQRNLRIDFAQAAAIIERMESEGLVGPYSGSGSHEILVSLEDWRADGM